MGLSRQRVKVLCPDRAAEKLRSGGRAAASTALFLHLTAGARLPAGIDPGCARP